MALGAVSRWSMTVIKTGRLPFVPGRAISTASLSGANRAVKLDKR